MGFYEIFNTIKEELKELYLRDNKTWVIAESFGKDSTMVLLLIWEMLQALPEEQRTKRVHVICSNTEVEEPGMDRYLKTNIQRVQQAADVQNLPISAHLCTPSIKNNYWWNVLGKGLPPVSFNSRFRWCSSRLKVSPINAVMDWILSQSEISLDDQYDVLLHLGVRSTESQSRSTSMEKHRIEDKFAKHNSRSNVLVYHPIKDLDGSQLWAYFYDYETFPWGTPVSELQSFYPEDIFECSLKTDGEQGSSCGNGRNGCYVCTAVKEDKMMKNLVEKDSSLQPLYDFKLILAEIRNDARYRMSTKRNELKKTSKRLAAGQQGQNQLDLIRDELVPDDAREAIEYKHRVEYEIFDRANDLEYCPGSLTIEARILLLRKLLFIQEQTGFPLISDTIIEEIQNVWNEEGYNIADQDLTPYDWQYDGAVVFNEDGILKDDETTNKSPQFWVHQDFSMGRDEIIKYIEEREKETCKSFLYYIDNVDMGENEAFSWNVIVFLVCEESIQEEKEAFDLINSWLYKPQPVEEMDWNRFANRYYEAAKELIKNPFYDIKALQQLNKVLSTLGKEPVAPNREIEEFISIEDTGQLALFA